MAEHLTSYQSNEKVWLDLDQTALDDAYDQSKYASNIEIMRKRNLFNSSLTRTQLGNPDRYAYGSTDIEKLDLFRSQKRNSPINVFIHGGAWKKRSAANYHFLANLHVSAGINFSALDFVGVDQSDGELSLMYDQVKRALIWIYKNARSIGADPEQIFLSAHSSGAHLGGLLCTTNWVNDGLPADLLKGAFLCSGIYDLRPVRLSKRSEYVKFDDEIERNFSAQRHIERINCPIILAYGTCESPEFQRQSKDFAAEVESAGKPVKLLVCETYNHFEMLEMMANPCSLLGQAIIQQMHETGAKPQ